MRLLITGGAGTLGADLVGCLLSRDDVERVDVVDNFTTSLRQGLPIDDRLHIHEGSIADKSFLQEVFETGTPSVVVHSAASYANPDDWEGDVHSNVLGAINLVRAAEARSIDRFINFQTVLCYGRPDSVPIEEEAPLRPLGSYAISKVAAEQFIMQSELPVTSLRIGSVLSMGLAIGPLPNFYRQVKQGEVSRISMAVRDFLDPEDFLTLMDKVLFGPHRSGIFNVSTGIGHSIDEIHTLVCKHFGVTGRAEIIPISDSDVAAIVLDSQKAQQAFGWNPTTSFEDSVRNLLNWYDIHGVGTTYSHHRN